MKLKSKVLCVVLSAMMLVAFMPVMAFAEGEASNGVEPINVAPAASNIPTTAECIINEGETVDVIFTSNAKSHDWTFTATSNDESVATVSPEFLTINKMGGKETFTITGMPVIKDAETTVTITNEKDEDFDPNKHHNPDLPRKVEITVKVKHVHDYKYTVVDSARYLHNGKAQNICKCGDVEEGSDVVLPGWSNNYVKKLKVSKGKKAFTVKWKKQSKKNRKNFTGYQIRYSKSKSMANPSYAWAKNTKSAKKIKKLAKKSKYYVQVRTYKTVGNVKYYAKSWGKVKAVKTR